MNALINFTMPKRSELKEEIMGKMQCKGGGVAFCLRPDSNDRLRLIVNGTWFATITHSDSIDGEYMLLSYPNSEHETRGSIGHIAAVLSGLQKNDFDWESMYAE